MQDDRMQDAGCRMHTPWAGFSRREAEIPPYYPTAVLPYCLTARLPYCVSGTWDLIPGT
jgi:hypothetical protein